MAMLFGPVPAFALAQETQDSGKAYTQETASLIELGNAKVALRIDRHTGFFRDIYNKLTGLHHKASEDAGTWPYGLRLGRPRSPDLLRVEITADALHPQRMSYTADTTASGKTVEMRYENMVTTGGTASGIRLTVSITLKNSADYFLIRARLENESKYEVTNFYAGGSGLSADSAHEKETLAAPGWSFGTLWPNPHSHFVERETFGYPIFGSNSGLAAGWIDLYGEKGGIGIGYLNRQGLTMLFNILRAREGMKINWQLFNVMHDKAFDPGRGLGGVYGLKPGEEFTTDWWILAPHAGDWHRHGDSAVGRLGAHVRGVLGLVDDPGLVARSYRDDKGITVLYYGREDVDTRIRVDKSALGLKGGLETVQIRLKKNEAGFKIIRP